MSYTPTGDWYGSASDPVHLGPPSPTRPAEPEPTHVCELCGENCDVREVRFDKPHDRRSVCCGAYFRTVYIEEGANHERA